MEGGGRRGVTNHKEKYHGLSSGLWVILSDSKTTIPPAYVAWRASTITLFLLGS